MSLNNVCIMGRLTADPELRRTGSGNAVVSFTLAVDRDFKDGNGQKQTDFIDVTAWRNTAEFVNSYFSKGRQAVVNGRLQTRKWEDKNGNKRQTVEVVADHVYFGDSRPNNAAPAQGYTAPIGTAPGADYAVLPEDDSELPF